MDLLSGLRGQRFSLGNLGQANARALDIVDQQYGQEDRASEAPLAQAANELVHRLNDLPLGGTIFLTKAEFERTFEGDEASRRLAAITLTEQCGCHLLFRGHPQTWVVITRRQRRSEVNVSRQAKA